MHKQILDIEYHTESIKEVPDKTLDFVKMMGLVQTQTAHEVYQRTPFHKLTDSGIHGAPLNSDSEYQDQTQQFARPDLGRHCV